MNRKLDINQLDIFTPAAAAVIESIDEDILIENEHSIRESFLSDTIPYNKKFILKSEAFVLKLAHAYNKILSLSNSRTRVLAHQVESTHRIVNSFKQRFLIADEVGLGKTIEAGLVIKEMIYRYNYKRILIVCPASIMFQWQNEMESKFNEKFTIMDRRILNRSIKGNAKNRNPWRVHDKIICSLDFIKNKNFESDLIKSGWDYVIFDEAHRLRRDAHSSTLSYHAAEIISSKTNSLLLLSATPFRGKLEELFFLIALIDKNILGPFQTFYNEYCIDGADLSELKRKLDKVIIRRTKKEVGGFTKRFARTVRFELYPDERYLYDETTKYVVEEFNRAIQSENRAIGFVMTVFQKLLDSSSYALYISLMKRTARLEELLERAKADQQSVVIFNNNIFDDISEYDDIKEKDNLTIQRTIDDLKSEIDTLNKLIVIASKIDSNKKGEKLIELIKDLKIKGHKKILIFTQFRTTQEYIKDTLKGFNAIIFNGTMNRDQKEEAILQFKDNADILIATEAGGEGRNIQFCDVLINYDLPWSPLKIEQRIGRIHRFGQPNDVHIYNFSTRDTVAERVLEVLTDKLKIFEESIGAPDIMLGQIEDEANLDRLFMEFASGRKNKREIEAELAYRIEDARQSFEKLTELTLSEKMNFNYDEYYRVTLKERSITNKRIERFINTFMQEDAYADNIISQKNPKTDLYRVTHSKGEGDITNLATFDSDRALDNEGLEFLAFGNEVIDNIIRYCCSSEFGGDTGILFVDDEKKFSGLIFNFIVEYSSVSVFHKFYSILISDDTLSGFELKSIEENLIDLRFNHNASLLKYTDTISAIKAKYRDFFIKGRERLTEKINDCLFDLHENLEIQIDPEVEKVKESYRKTLKELEEKLDIQESQMKWYGKDMRSAITRTKKSILNAKTEMESILQQYRNCYGINYKIQLTGAAIIISPDD
ncbi:MAG: SNF2-related protein [Leptospirales bacterium]|nr:SNF2-related protein [Leptospirales bacterium]